VAISLVAPAEQRMLRRIEAFTHSKIRRASLPTEQDILEQREAQLLNQMSIWLQRARYKRERELVARLVEQGHDPLEIAAAALKIARADEKQRPIAPVGDAQVAQARQSPGREITLKRTLSPGNVSHEAGMIRLAISKGRAHGVRPNDVVSTLAFHAEIPGYAIGKIHIQDQCTLVDVPENYAAQVLAKTGAYRIHKQPVQIDIA
jgi:ATP-dependent RNA helicase DeaD